MNFALPTSHIDLPADTDQPRPPSLESWLLAASGVLAFLGGVVNQSEIATPIASCGVVVAMLLGMYEIGRWAYRRFRHSQ